MSLTDINQYYTLETINVSPNRLILDPGNPRLTVDIEDDIEYSGEQLISEDVQLDVLNKINKSEFKIHDLITSISEKGFTVGSSPIIIKEINGYKKYLVLEGNRRTAAMKNILSSSGDVDDACLATLKRIEAKKFVYKNNDKYSEEQIINVLLGQIHIQGALGWGAMERAHYIYRSYAMELLSKYNRNTFYVDKELINNVSKIYSFKSAEILNNLKIYRVYEQIKSTGYQIKSDRFSLIEQSVTDGALSEDYFELQDNYNFTERGLDNFINLIGRPDSPVKNPRLFRQFSYIFKNGTASDVEKIENDIADIESVHADVKKRKKGNHLYERLNQILEDIKKIDISELVELTQSSKEFKEAQEIVHTVLKKLYPIIDNIKNSDTYVNEYWPDSIDELLGLKSKDIQNLIRETLRETRGKSCQADFSQLATATLNYLEIQAHGPMRQQYYAMVKKEAKQMLKSGIIKMYKSSANDRFKLIG